MSRLASSTTVQRLRLYVCICLNLQPKQTLLSSTARPKLATRQVFTFLRAPTSEREKPCACRQPCSLNHLKAALWPLGARAFPSPLRQGRPAGLCPADSRAVFVAASRVSQDELPMSQLARSAAVWNSTPMGYSATCQELAELPAQVRKFTRCSVQSHSVVWQMHTIDARSVSRLWIK